MNCCMSSANANTVESDANLKINLFQYYILQRTIFSIIEEVHIQESGLYRIPGSEKDAMDVFKEFLKFMDSNRNLYIQGNTNIKHEWKDSNSFTKIKARLKDPLTLTTIIKTSLKKLPVYDKIVSIFLYPALKVCLCQLEQTSVIPIESLTVIINSMPLLNRLTLTELCLHCLKVSKYEKINSMGIVNLAIVFGPSVLTAHNENQLEEMRANAGIMKMIIEFFKSMFSESDDINIKHIKKINLSLGPAETLVSPINSILAHSKDSLLEFKTKNPLKEINIEEDIKNDDTKFDQLENIQNKKSDRESNIDTDKPNDLNCPIDI